MNTVIEIVEYNQKTRKGLAVSQDGKDVTVLGQNFANARAESRAVKGMWYNAFVLNGVAIMIEEREVE